MTGNESILGFWRIKVLLYLLSIKAMLLLPFLTNSRCVSTKYYFKVNDSIRTVQNTSTTPSMMAQ